MDMSPLSSIGLDLTHFRMDTRSAGNVPQLEVFFASQARTQVSERNLEWPDRGIGILSLRTRTGVSCRILAGFSLELDSQMKRSVRAHQQLGLKSSVGVALDPQLMRPSGQLDLLCCEIQATSDEATVQIDQSLGGHYIKHKIAAVGILNGGPAWTNPDYSGGSVPPQGGHHQRANKCYRPGSCTGQPNMWSHREKEPVRGRMILRVQEP